MKKVLVIGAGPAGLTAACEILRETNIHPIIFEKTDEIGGISRTVNYKGNRMDIGGHRFFSKDDRIIQFWLSVMNNDGDREMMERDRISRIYFLRKFFSYPISLTTETFKNLGIANTVKSGIAYLIAQLFPKGERTLEDFYITEKGVMTSYGKEIPYVKFSARIKKLPIGEISGIISVVKDEKGNDKILVSANKSEKYSQLISNEFFKEIK